MAAEWPDNASFRRVFGPRWQSLRAPGGADKADVAAFLKAADEQMKVDRGSDGKVARLTVGKNEWVLPIPLAAQGAGGWRFDIDAAYEEIAVRRIGHNELSTMQAMLAFVAAQREYAQADRNGDGVLEYARKLMASPGKRDGLIWDARLGESPSALSSRRRGPAPATTATASGCAPARDRARLAARATT